MIVIFDPQPPLMRWYKITDNGMTVEECTYKNDWEHEVSFDLKNITHIACVLYNGGDAISEAVVTINPDLIATVEKCVPLLPERNQMTLETIQYWHEKLPTVNHTLLCETALYTKLPPKARNYAIPAELREKGVKRYGGYGLQHAFMLDKIKPALNGSAGKLVSIFLGPQTNVTAFYEGKPLETSIGFSPAEGIPSLHGSGDTDASFVFLMQENGYELDDIAPAFSKKGGLCALLGKEDCTFPDVINSGADNLTYKVLRYSLIKYIGYAVTQLGGADAFSFHGEYDIKTIEPFIRDVCRNFKFLGLTCADKPETKKGFVDLTGKELSVKVFYTPCKRAEVLEKYANQK